MPSHCVVHLLCVAQAARGLQRRVQEHELSRHHLHERVQDEEAHATVPRMPMEAAYGLENMPCIAAAHDENVDAVLPQQPSAITT